MERRGARGFCRPHDRGLAAHERKGRRLRVAVRSRVILLLQNQVRRTVHDVPRLARDHKVAVIEGRECESSEEQDEAPRDEDLRRVGEEGDQESPNAL